MAKRKAPPQPQTEVQVDLQKADTIKCDDCGNYLFITSHVIKRISPNIVTIDLDTYDNYLELSNE